MCSTKKEHRFVQHAISKDSLTKKDKATNTNKQDISRDTFLLDNLLNYHSEEALIKVFGKSAITRAEEFSSEVEGSWWVSVLFQGTKNEVRFLWSDGSKYEIPYKIYHSGSASFNYLSDWKTSEGIRLGTTIPELEKLNNGAFTFYGFAWNFEGQVNWTDQARHAKGVYVSLRIPEEKRIKQIEDDQEILSDSELAKQTKPIVGFIELRKIK
jgi:hypothetical protein